MAVTIGPFRASHPTVRFLLPFMICLMLAMTGLSGMAHAADVAGGSFAGVEFTAHSAGDLDEVPADADKGVTHHHNYCHGHEIGAPLRLAIDCTYVLTSPVPAMSAAAALDGRVVMIHLKPPKA